MVRAAKPKKKPADFKRPKRKVGRRVAPAANVTSVGITSRRINLLEQSLLQDKTNIGQLTHSHQTLPELLQHISHYNAHVRERALKGLKELATQETSKNLQVNACALLERFLPTLLDEEGIVRNAAVQAWKALLHILSSVLAPFATLVATFLSSGLTHLQVGVRQDTLKAIDEMVENAPQVLKKHADQEAVARLLENFRDLICSTQTPGIKMMNSYGVLGNLESNRNRGAQGRHKNTKKQQKTSIKAKKPSGALALRFEALKVLHKLLLSVSSEHSNRTTGVTASAWSTSVPKTKTLLLYPNPSLIATTVNIDVWFMPNIEMKTRVSWQEKVRPLLPALLDLWLECLEGSIDGLSDVHVEHMKYIVECTTTVLGANPDLLKTGKNEAKMDEFVQAALKLREELLAPQNFPLLPSVGATLTADSDVLKELSRWHGINAALARLACEFLHSSTWMHESDQDVPEREMVEQQIYAYVIETLAKFKQTPELRAIASMQNVLAPLLEVVNLMVTSASHRISVSVAKNNAIEKETRLLDAVTQFFVICTPTSLSFRSCTAFVVNQLEIALRGQQRQRLKLPWPMVMQWVVCLATFLGQLDPQHMELGRRTLVALISVLKQLPVKFTKGDQMDNVLINLSNIFDVAGVPSSSMTEDERKRMRGKTSFDALAAADQLAFVSLVYHLPSYPVSLLRALASCCKSSNVDSEAKSFLVDIVFQRREAIDLAHINSFFVSTALASVEDKAHEQHQQLKLVHHVCRTLLAMKLGNSLSKILTPTLAKVHAGGTMNLMKMHALMLLYRVCIASATRSAEERADIPVEMERELVDLSVKVLVNCMRSSATEHSEATNSRDQELLLVETCMSTLVLGETNLFTMFLDNLVVGQEPELVVTHRLRVLQVLVRTSSLAGPFRRHQSHTRHLLHVVEQQHADADNIMLLVRKVRGDLQLFSSLTIAPTSN